MAVPYHTHTFDIPTASKEEVAEVSISDKVVVPSALGTAAAADTTDFAAAAPNLEAIGDLASDADTGIFFSGPGEAALYDLSPFVRSISDSQSADEFREAIGVAGADEGRAPWVHKLVNTLDLEDAFTNWDRANQGIAAIVVGGVQKVFVSNIVAGSTYAMDERVRIVECNVTDDGSALVPVAISEELNIGHAQDLGVELVGGDVVIWTTASTPTVNSTDAGKGFSRIEWRGADTSQSDVTTYMVNGLNGSGHRREHLHQATVTLSDDGQYLVAIVEDVDEDREHKVLVYSKTEVMTAPDPLDVDPVSSWSLPTLPRSEGRIVQGADATGNALYILTGYYNPFGWTTVQKFGLHSGVEMDRRAICPVQTELGLDELLDSATYTGFRIEGEGITQIRGDLIVGFYETRYTGGAVVSLEGQNFAYIGTGATVSPHDMMYWQRSLQTAGGAYNSGSTYSIGTPAFVRKSLWKVGPSRGEVGETPVSPLTYFSETTAPSSYDDEVSGVYKLATGWVLKGWSESLRKFYNGFMVRLGQLRLYDDRVGVDNSEYALIERDSSAGATYIRGNQSLTNGAGINLYDVDSAAPGQARIIAIDPAGNITRTLFFRGSSAAFYGASGETSLGLLAFPWRDVVSQKMTLVDGVAAPSTVSGAAQIYVDNADGDLKIKFGDGTVKTIVTDT